MEFFASYGVLNYYLGELSSKNFTKQPSVPIEFLDNLGYSKGGRGFVFLMLLAVLKIRFTLNGTESSWGYLKNLRQARSQFIDEELEDADEARKEDVLDKKDLITVYYLTLNYIDIEMKYKKGTITSKGKDALEMELCLLGISKNHSENCKNAKCYCKLQKVILNGSDESAELLRRGYPKDEFDSQFAFLRESLSVKMSVEYMEQQFENYVSYHGLGDDQVVYPYIKFLLLYSGRITRGLNIFQKKLTLVRSEKRGEQTSTDIEDIKIIIQRVIDANQVDGSLYLIKYSELLSSEVTQNSYIQPKNVILFLDAFQSLKTLSLEISDLKFGILEAILNTSGSKANSFHHNIPSMMNLGVKKHLLYKVCMRLRQTQYWFYTPLLVLLSWLFGAIIEDEYGWGSIVRMLFKTQFKGFYSLEARSETKGLLKHRGGLGEEWEFKRDYDPVLVYVDTEETPL